MRPKRPPQRAALRAAGQATSGKVLPALKIMGKICKVPRSIWENQFLVCVVAKWAEKLTGDARFEFLRPAPEMLVF